MRVFGIVGRCKAKAGVVSRLVAAATARGLQVSTVKRVNDRVDLDRPGTSSWGQREAGARQVVLASGTRIAVLEEARAPAEEPDLAALLAGLAKVDLVLLEGFRGAGYPKLEVVEPGQDRRLQALDDPSVCAVASTGAVEAPVAFFAVEDTEGLLALVLERAVAADQPLWRAEAI